MAGKIQYTTPSIMELHGLPYEAFNSMSVFSYYLSLMDYDENLQTINYLACVPQQP